jgi:hypothetical protein
MQPERPECQCLACAQLQHHQANDTLLLVAIGTVVVVGGLVWLVGQLAGLLASGAWPNVSLSELPGILVRLRDHAGDPAAAWPAGVRDRLPGPLGMYATLIGILATPLALGALAWWLQQPPPPDAAGVPCHRPPIRACQCCRRPSTTRRRRDSGHPGCPADRAHRPRVLWRGRAGMDRHQPRGGPPLRSDPPASPLVYPLAYPPISDRGGELAYRSAVWPGSVGKLTAWRTTGSRWVAGAVVSGRPPTNFVVDLPADSRSHPGHAGWLDV